MDVWFYYSWVNLIMNAGVILAAGDSTRMGFLKQLAEIRDKPILELIVEKVNNYFEFSSVELPPFKHPINMLWKLLLPE